MSTKQFATASWLLAATSILATAQTPYVITNVNSQMALDVPNFSKNAGTPIEQYPPNGATNQQWVLHRPGPDIAYEIRSVSSSLILGTPEVIQASGVPIQQVSPGGGGNQTWQIVLAAGSMGYGIVAAYSSPSWALDVPHSSTQSGIAIQEFVENDGPNQQWIFNANPDGYVRVNGVLKEAPIPGILLTGNGSGATLSGWNFRPGTSVCPVTMNPVYRGLSQVYPCTAVQPDGTISASIYAPNNSAPYPYHGHIVVAVEDQNQNVLALGSTPGPFIFAPK